MSRKGQIGKPFILLSYYSNKVGQVSKKGQIHQKEKKIPGKLRARPVQHPATPALMTADVRVFALSVEKH